MFSRPEPLLVYSSSSSIELTRLSGPRSRHYYSENLVAPGIEPETSVSVARNSDLLRRTNFKMFTTIMAPASSCGLNIRINSLNLPTVAKMLGRT
jgi:hypothetical protein